MYVHTYTYIFQLQFYIINRNNKSTIDEFLKFSIINTYICLLEFDFIE